MPWMNVLRKPRLNRTVVRVAVDTALNLVRLLSLSDMAIPFRRKRTMVSVRRDELSIVDKSRGLYTGFERQRRDERISRRSGGHIRKSCSGDLSARMDRN